MTFDPDINKHTNYFFSYDPPYSRGNILELFLDATTALSGQNYPTIGLAFYVFRLLQHFLDFTTRDDAVTIALKESLRY